GVVEPAIQPDDGVGAVHGNRLGGGRAESGAESQAMRQRENPDDAAPDQSRGEDKTSRARDAMRHLPDGADGRPGDTIVAGKHAVAGNPMTRTGYLPLAIAALSASLSIEFAQALSAGGPAVRAPEPATMRGKLVTTGPDTMEGMMKAWIVAFNERHPEGEVTFVLKECHPEDRCTAGPDVDEVYANT